MPRFARLLAAAQLLLAPGLAALQQDSGDPRPEDGTATIALFAIRPPSGDAPLAVNFVDRSFGGVTGWAWEFGDGATSTLQNPTHVYTEAGLYSARLTVTGPHGTATLEKYGSVIVRRCTLESARENRSGPLERGEDFVPVSGDDSLGFYCVYSGKAVAPDNLRIDNNVGMFLFPLTNGGVLLFGSGYGDANAYVEPTEDADHDVGRLDAIIRFCLGRIPANTPVHFVTPHGHMDHLNADCIRELRERGYPIAEIAFHTRDATLAKGLPGWTTADRALFRTLRNNTNYCQEELLSFASPLGKIWFFLREGHTAGSIDLVIDVRGNPGNRFVVRGSGESYGTCPLPGVREAIEPHGNVLLRAPQPKVFALSTLDASALGGTEVVVSGEGFRAADAGAPAVFFDGALASAVNVLADDTLICVAPPGIPGEVVNVRVLNRNGQALVVGGFSYRALPTLTGLTPVRGLASGGTRVTLTGSGFLANAPGTNRVSFGGIPAAAVQVLDDGRLQCTTPPHAAGPVGVTLANLNGSCALAGSFLYDPLVDVLSVSPATGSSLGGTRVQVTGSAFASGATVPEVFFGSARATSVVRVSDTRLDCTTPAGPSGVSVDVRVSTQNGSDALAAGFRYFVAPKITGLGPTSGSESGGTQVTLTGSNFTKNAAGPNGVTFGGVAASGIVTVSDTSIRCLAPAGAGGTSVDVQVSNANGTGRLDLGYRYHGPPLLVSLSPELGARTGGTLVTLRGSGFQESGVGTTAVLFGGVAALDVLLVDDTTLTCRTPAAAGSDTVDVVLINANGRATLAQGYRYVTRPVPLGLDPGSGPASGGTNVTIRGAGFLAEGAGETVVRFASTAASNVRVIDEFTLTCSAPIGLPGSRVDVHVANLNGSAQLPEAYAYLALPTLGTIWPSEGKQAGGTRVRVSGSGFSAGSEPLVRFGAGTALDLVVLDERRLECTTPPGATGAVDVLVHTRGGTAVLVEAFVYGSTRPTITSIGPDHGTSQGGTPIEIRGSNFMGSLAGASTVQFGGAAAGSVVALNDTTLRCVAPPGVPGALVDVRLSNANGSVTQIAGFRYHLQPVLASVSPAESGALGGTTVTLRGSGFVRDEARDLAIRFGPALAEGILVVDDTTVRCTAPAGSAGTVVDVELSNSNGKSLLPGAFRYLAGPTLASIAPSSGTPLGGTIVTLSGAGFAGAGPTSVRFGANAATQVTVVNDTTLTCRVPPGSAGTTVDVLVENLNGAVTLGSCYRYHAAPAIATLAPANGPAAGVTTVVVSGSGFKSDVSGANAVTFGGRAARSVVTVDDTRVRAVAPVGTGGESVDLVLSNSNGTTRVVAGFRYNALPTIGSLEPPGASALGLVTVTIRGSGFQRDGAGANSVLFGTVPAGSVSVLDDQTLSCVAPAGAAGTEVVVSLSNANGAASAVAPFRYHAAPTITSVDPAQSPAEGGAVVTLRGTGFSANAAGTPVVRFDSRSATGVSVVDDTTVRCTAPAGSAGTVVDVELSNSNGKSLLPGAFRYLVGPTLLSIAPPGGTPLGGTTVTLSGAGFAGAGPTSVRFGANAATQVTVVNDTTLTCRVPPGAAGTTVDVLVENLNGAVTLGSCYRYHAAPAIATLAPANGPAAGVTTVVVSGSGFKSDVSGANAVTFGGRAARSVVTVDDTRVRAVAPAGTGGESVDLVLSNSNGTTRVVAGFRYNALPTIGSLEPPGASALGLVTVTIRGSGFQRDGAGANSVLFGTVPAGSVSVLDDQTLSCVAPAGAAGTEVVVSLSNANGAASAAAPFRYHAAPRIDELVPAFGFSGGGALVEIHGAGWLANGAGPNSVLFGAAPATEVSVVDDGVLRCRAPAGAPGPVPVRVDNANGSTTRIDGFYYDWAPTLTDLQPAQGSSLGGTEVRLTGAGFATPGAGTLSVRFGSAPATNVRIQDGGSLLCTAPAGPAGTTVVVVLSNSNGSASLSGFRYHAGPTITSVDPTRGLPEGGTIVTLRGTGFSANAAGTPVVRFDSSGATGVTVVDDTTVRCTAPAGPAHTFAQLMLSNANGTATRADGFRWLRRDPGDLDDDGVADALLSGTDGVYLHLGALFGLADKSTASADLVLRPSSAGTDFGAQLACGDLNADQVQDLVVTAPLDDAGGTDAGAVFVFFGPLSASPTPRLASSASAVFRGAAAGDRFGTSAVVRDVTGDGAPDLLVGAPFHDTAGSEGGAVYVYRGNAGFTGQTTAQAAVRLLASSSQDSFGAALAAADVTGDARADVIVGAPLQGSGSSGTVHVFRGGPTLASTTASSALVVIDGDDSGDALGTSVAAADFDGDGIDDLFLGAPDARSNSVSGGALYLLRGGATLVSRSADDDSVELNAESSGDRIGQVLAMGDVNGDGRADLLAGAPQHDVPASGCGRAYLLLGGPLQDGSIDQRAHMILMASSSGDQFGAGLGLTDLDGDGRADLLVGAPYSNGSSSDTGRVHVFWGSALQATRSAGADDVTFTGASASLLLGREVAGAR